MLRGVPATYVVAGGVIGAIVGWYIFQVNDRTNEFAIPFMACLGALVACDLVRRVLPNPLVIAAGLSLVAAVAMEAVRNTTLGFLLVVLAVLGGAILAGLYATIAHLMPGQLGFGDVKLAFVCGGWISAFATVDLVLVIFVLALASALLAIIGKMLRKPALPYGPAIVIPTALVSLLVW